MGADFLARLILYIPISMFFSALVTPFFCLLRKIFYVPFVHKRLLQKAIDKGNMLEAKLIKSFDEHERVGTHGRISTGKRIGVYEYFHNGKRYRYRATSANGLPATMTMYYLKSPRRASPPDYVGFRERCWPKFFLIFTLVFTVVMIVMGGPNG